MKASLNNNSYSFKIQKEYRYENPFSLFKIRQSYKLINDHNISNTSEFIDNIDIDSINFFTNIDILIQHISNKNIDGINEICSKKVYNFIKDIINYEYKLDDDLYQYLKYFGNKNLIETFIKLLIEYKSIMINTINENILKYKKINNIVSVTVDIYEHEYYTNIHIDKYQKNESRVMDFSGSYNYRDKISISKKFLYDILFIFNKKYTLNFLDTTLNFGYNIFPNRDFNFYIYVDSFFHKKSILANNIDYNSAKILKYLNELIHNIENESIMIDNIENESIMVDNIENKSIIINKKKKSDFFIAISKINDVICNISNYYNSYIIGILKCLNLEINKSNYTKLLIYHLQNLITNIKYGMQYLFSSQYSSKEHSYYIEFNDDISNIKCQNSSSSPIFDHKANYQLFNILIIEANSLEKKDDNQD